MMMNFKKYERLSAVCWVRRDPTSSNSILLNVSAVSTKGSQVKSIFEYDNEIALNENSIREVEWG